MLFALKTFDSKMTQSDLTVSSNLSPSRRGNFMRSFNPSGFIYSGFHLNEGEMI